MAGSFNQIYCEPVHQPYVVSVRSFGENVYRIVNKMPSPDFAALNSSLESLSSRTQDWREALRLVLRAKGLGEPLETCRFPKCVRFGPGSAILPQTAMARFPYAMRKTLAAITGGAGVRIADLIESA